MDDKHYPKLERGIKKDLDPTLLERKRVIRWVNGDPVAVEEIAMGGSGLANTLGVIMAREYTPLNEDDAKLNAGKTNAQVVLERLVTNAVEGDMSSIKEVLDRVMGKPVAHTTQDIRSVNMSMTYEDFLNTIPKEDLVDDLVLDDYDDFAGLDGIEPNKAGSSIKNATYVDVEVDVEAPSANSILDIDDLL